MPIDFGTVDTVLSVAVPDTTPAAQLTIRSGGRCVFSQAYGYLDPDTRLRPVQRTALFDLASLTKVFTSAAFMRLVEDGRSALDQPISSVLPEFSGLRPILPYEDPLRPGSWVDVTGQAHRPGRAVTTVDAGRVTFRQILRHSSGLPAWRPLKDQPDAAAAAQLAIDTFFSYLPDTRIVYSDIGLILLGMAVSRLCGQELPRVIEELVTGPLGLAHTRFLPVGHTLPLDAAPTEFCAWRKRRVIGEVHDESASRLGGIAGHAGLFSTADEVARFGQAFLPDLHRSTETGPLVRLLRTESVAAMTRAQFEYGQERRGLGFALWSPDPEASSHPFGPDTFGHTGFTGTSLWIDPGRRLVVALLTNEVYHGRQNRGIAGLRLAVHRAVVQAVELASTP
jgi:CubicO group peptidase (beta-lactamase class C family)